MQHSGPDPCCTTTTYLYDGDGKRLQASTGTQASKKTNFLWDVIQGVPQLALERDGSGALRRRYAYDARRVSQTAGSNTSYYLYDGIGSVANLTSSAGATQWTWSYEPFGGIRTEQKASGDQPDNFHKFTGEYADPTGLYHLRARQYDPQTGRFLGRDPRPAAGGARRGLRVGIRLRCQQADDLGRPNWRARLGSGLCLAVQRGRRLG